jgi:hypothetical protein
MILNFIFKSSITTQKYPSGPCQFFQETQQFFEVFWNTQNSWFLEAEVFKIPSLNDFFKSENFQKPRV